MQFFKHDTNALANPKIRKVIRTHGAVGYGIWWAILEHLYVAEEKGFQIIADELWLENLAEQLHLSDPRTLIRVLDTFAELGLISSQLWAEQVLFCPSIAERGDRYVQKRVYERDKKRKQREVCPSVVPGDKTGTEGQNANVPLSDPDSDPDSDSDPKQNLNQDPVRAIRSAHAHTREDNRGEKAEETNTQVDRPIEPEPPAEPLATTIDPPTTQEFAPLSTIQLRQGQNAPQFSDERLFNGDLLDSLMAEPPPDVAENEFVHPTLQTEARFRYSGDTYPWKRDRQALKLFIDYLANSIRRRDETIERARNIAVAMIRKANAAAPGTKEHMQVYQPWLLFVENAKQSHTVEQATGKKPLVPASIQALLERRGLA